MLSTMEKRKEMMSVRWNSHNTEKVIKTPPMADSITEGELTRLEKKVGDQVNENDVVAVIETDKVDIEVPTPVNGTIMEFYVKPGDTVKVGSDLFKIRIGEVVPRESKASAPEPTAVEPKMKAKPEKEADGTKLPSAEKVTPTTTESLMNQQREVPSSSTGERRVKMSRISLRIADRLKESQNTAASLTTFNEIDM
jgi:2-oxoglutarate dehydrogenase E2 component (dihydrolipoamide succinyltransferase)